MLSRTSVTRDTMNTSIPIVLKELLVLLLLVLLLYYYYYFEYYSFQVCSVDPWPRGTVAVRRLSAKGLVREGVGSTLQKFELLWFTIYKNNIGIWGNNT